MEQRNSCGHRRHRLQPARPRARNGARQSGAGNSSPPVLRSITPHSTIFPARWKPRRNGFLPGGLKNNRDFIGDCVEFAPAFRKNIRDLLFDPQTAGGLLVSIATGRRFRCSRRTRAPQHRCQPRRYRARKKIAVNLCRVIGRVAVKIAHVNRTNSANGHNHTRHCRRAHRQRLSPTAKTCSRQDR